MIIAAMRPLTADGSVQFLVRLPHLFDFVDGIQHRGVMSTSKLTADFRERRHVELSRDDMASWRGRR
jgi:hypothetical protein